MSNYSNKIAANTVIQIAGRLAVLVLSLISIKLISTYLGPQGTGFYNTVITYLSFAIVIADFGLFSVVVREISKRPEQKKKIFANVFLIRFVSAVLITLLAVGIAFLTNYPQEVKIGVAAAALFPIFNLAGSVYDMLFQHKLEMQKVVWAEVISKIIVVSVIFVVSFLRLGYYPIVLTVSLAAVLNFLIKMLISRRDLPLSFSFDKGLSREIAKMALPLGIVFIVNNIYFKIDTLMLFYFKGAAAVGIYAIAYRVLETTLFAGSYLIASLKPFLSVSMEKDKSKVASALTTAATYLVFMAVAIGILCIAFSKEVILFLSNAEFISGSKALILLGFAPVLIFVSGLLGEILVAKDMRRTMIFLSTFILAVNVALNIVLIPRYSFNGAALATVLSEIILVSGALWAARQVVAVRFDFLRISKLIGLGMLSILIAFLIKESRLYFIFNFAIVILLYGFLAYQTHAIPREMLDNFIASIRKKWQNRLSRSS